MSTQTNVKELPRCDFCKRFAQYDGRTIDGPWAYMCDMDWIIHGCGQLGTGHGQRLIVESSVARARQGAHPAIGCVLVEEVSACTLEVGDAVWLNNRRMVVGGVQFISADTLLVETTDRREFHLGDDDPISREVRR